MSARGSFRTAIERTIAVVIGVLAALAIGDAITLDATDNGGIRRVEIIDVTGGGAGVVGAEDYATGARTVTGATCSFRLAKACPNLRNETIRPTSLAAG